MTFLGKVLISQPVSQWSGTAGGREKYYFFTFQIQQKKIT